jgi:hypothetical protein
MEKNYPNHPEVIYFTDGIINPYYKTIPIEMSLDKWTKGLREFLNQIPSEQVLLMIDDCFIRQPVDIQRIEEALSIIQSEPNVACMNFEKSWDERDLPTDHDGWKVRQHGSEYEVSLMCGLWSKEKLIDVIDRDCSPWEIELNQDGKGFDYYINSADYIIDWGYRTFQPCGKVKGVWTQEAKDFLKTEGFIIP